jgi:UDP-N-acetylenolpyruvoylglucosamine reductase
VDTKKQPTFADALYCMADSKISRQSASLSLFCFCRHDDAIRQACKHYQHSRKKKKKEKMYSASGSAFSLNQPHQSRIFLRYISSFCLAFCTLPSNSINLGLLAFEKIPRPI